MQTTDLSHLLVSAENTKITATLFLDIMFHIMVLSASDCKWIFLSLIRAFYVPFYVLENIGISEQSKPKQILGMLQITLLMDLSYAAEIRHRYIYESL